MVETLTKSYFKYQVGDIVLYQDKPAEIIQRVLGNYFLRLASGALTQQFVREDELLDMKQGLKLQLLSRIRPYLSPHQFLVLLSI